jgi:enoyl-CoA hydratase/carnithine racemase
MTTMSEPILRELRDSVLVLTLNRPEKLNAINRAMRAAIRQAVEDLRDDSAIRVLLIKANGRYFTAGVDMGEMAAANADATPADVRRDYRKDHLLHDEMEAVEKPIVMAIQGPCLGLGVELGGSCDFRLASEEARFGLPEVNLGFIAGSGGTSRFSRLCGVGWSKWLNMAGEQIDARTAQIAGFVQAVYPADRFEEEVWAFCQRLVSRPGDVQGIAKHAIELAYDLDREGARHVERIVNTPLMMRDNSALIAKSRARPNKP